MLLCRPTALTVRWLLFLLLLFFAPLTLDLLCLCGFVFNFFRCNFSGWLDGKRLNGYYWAACGSRCIDAHCLPRVRPFVCLVSWFCVVLLRVRTRGFAGDAGRAEKRGRGRQTDQGTMNGKQSCKRFLFCSLFDRRSRRAQMVFFSQIGTCLHQLPFRARVPAMYSYRYLCMFTGTYTRSIKLTSSLRDDNNRIIHHPVPSRKLLLLVVFQLK